MPIKLVIFDLDGTLIDSSVDISNALNHAIEPFGIAAVSVAETLSLVGEGVSKLVEKLVRSRGRDIDVPLLVKRFLDYYSDHAADNTSPYPGVDLVLAELTSVKKVVVSNKLESLTLKALEALDLRRHFDYVAGADTLSQKKPSPEPILEVLSMFDVSPHESVMVGDSIYDMEAGRAAGVRTVAVLYGFGSPGFDRLADFRIAAMSELPHVLQGMS